MRRKCLLVWMCCVVLLSGCTRERDPAQCALDLRTELMEAGGCAFQTEVTAHYEDRAYVFSLDCAYADGTMSLTVTEPESIAGIQAVVRQGETQLEYDGAVLDFGKLANGYVSPVAAPWLMVQCWLEEYIAYVGTDADQQRITYLRGYDEAELAVDTWIREGIPTYAEVTCDGVRCLTAVISDFQGLS